MSQPKPISQILDEAKQAYERGQKVRAAMEADPLFREFIESGDDRQVSRLVSMAYLVASVTNAYFEEAIGLMEKYDLVHKKIKTTSNNLTQSFDSFDKAISALIDTQEAKLQLCSDYDIFRAVCDRYMNADAHIDDAGLVKENGETPETDNPHTTETMKRPNPKQNQPRKVIAYESDGIKTFDSVKEAAEHYGIHIQSVYALINSGKETDGGVSFDYQKWED